MRVCLKYILPCLGNTNGRIQIGRKFAMNAKGKKKIKKLTEAEYEAYVEALKKGIPPPARKTE